MLRAVIYCRCSTEEESQQEALKKQVIEAKESVAANGWLLIDEYIESKSGTTSEKRKEYQRLYEDLASDKFDIVQIKSQDRLMRNTKDWYLFVDRLAANRKKLYFYIEQKFYTPDDALITGIKAILAEEYSKELSKKINNAHHNRQQRGESFILPSDTYGYQKMPDKSIVIMEEEAKVIRLMFHLCETMGCGRIAAELENEGYRDRRGQIFKEETIRKIIRNPIRCGTVIQNKRHFDFQLKQERKMPAAEWIVHKDALPAVVSETMWKKANEAMDKRAARYCPKEKCEIAGRGKFDFSGKLVCGQCKESYYRTCRRNSRTQLTTVEWKCQNYLRYGRRDSKKVRKRLRKSPQIKDRGCDNIHLDEERLLALLEDIWINNNDYYQWDDSEIIKQVNAVLKSVIRKKEPIGTYYQLEQRIYRQDILSKRLMDKLLDGIISDEDYKQKRQEINKRQQLLEKELKNLQETKNLRSETGERLQKINKKIQSDILRKAIRSVLLEKIEKIEIYEDKLKIILCGESAFGEAIIDVPLGKEFTYAGRKENERNKIIMYMRENPEITAREIAAKEQISLSAVNYRIKRLRLQGKLYFNGRGGQGKWVICEKGIGF